MTATLPERPPKRRKMKSRHLFITITKHENRAGTKLWQYTVRRQREQFQSEEPIAIERPMVRDYRISAESSSYSINGLNVSTENSKPLEVDCDWISKSHIKPFFDQLTLKMADILIRKQTEKTRSMDVSALIKMRSDEQRGSLDRLLKRIVSENHNQFLTIIRTTVAEYQKKAAEIREAALNNSDDAKSFSLLLSDLEEGQELPSLAAVDAVLRIQCLPIPELLNHETLCALVEFIRKHRSTSSPKVLIAVGAAIRKVLLNIGDEQLGLAAELMKSSGSLEVPIGVELEVAKMVVHRFRYAPNTSSAGLSDLAEMLLANARVYSKANLVNREYYGATALNSVLAIVLMRHQEASALIHHIESNSPGWFVDLVKSRLRRIAKEIENEKLEDAIALVDLMKVLGTKSIDSHSFRGDQ